MLKKKTLVGIGTKNPSKIKAVKKVFKKIYKNCVFFTFTVNSGVANQPLSLEETYKGALNRAKEVFKKNKKLDFAVGLEGGMEKFSFGWTTFGIIVVLDKKGRVGTGSSGHLHLPDKITKEILKGKELGIVLSKISNENKINYGRGAFGFFTLNFLTRQASYEQGVILALSRFLQEKMYEN